MKYVLLNRVSLLLIFGLLTIACQDEVTFDDPHASLLYTNIAHYTPEQITIASYEEQKIYTKYHLGTLSQALLSVANDRDFREILYSEVDKGELDESAVLLSNLFKRINTEKPVLFEKMRQNVSLADFDASQSAFWGIEENILFPQLYIPFYEKVHPSDKMMIKGSNMSPVVAIDPLENQETISGHSVDRYEQVIELKGIDEDFASESEVWIISLNESIKIKTKDFVSDCNTLSFLCYPEYRSINLLKNKSSMNAKTNGTCTHDGNTGNAKQNTSGKGIDVYIDRLTIKSHKEPWYAGSSDVWLGFTSVWGGGFNEFDFKEDRDHYWDPLQTVGLSRNEQIYSSGTISSDIIKVSRKKVKNKKELDLYDKQIEKWGEQRRKSTIAWVAFEMDSWPSPRIAHTVYTYPHKFPFPFRSEYQSNSFSFSISTRESTPYGSGYFNWYQGHSKYACGARESNSEIDINFITEKPL